jgi:hypothetical protein
MEANAMVAMRTVGSGGVDVRPAPVAPDVDVEQCTTPSTGDGDHDRFTHYVSRRELERYRSTGRPVTALCGKRWRPDGDPTRYPMCGTCAEMAAERLLGDLGS